MSKAEDYIGQQLGAVGFVLCAPRISFMLRRDLWPTAAMCDATSPAAKKYLGALASKMLLTLFTFEGEGLTGFGAAFNAEQLEKRIHDMYGIDVEITVVDSLMQPAPVQPGHDPQAHAARVRDENLKKLRKLAVQELPSHECSLRREILAARAELERMGEAWETTPAA